MLMDWECGQSLPYQSSAQRKETEGKLGPPSGHRRQAGLQHPEHL